MDITLSLPNMNVYAAKRLADEVEKFGHCS
jgi:hypothetical protein